MKLDKLGPNVFQVTLHTYELAALVTGARWIVDGARGEVAPEARRQLQQVLTSYEIESRRLTHNPARMNVS